MENYQQLVSTISLTMGAAWASGINLYAAIGTLGILGLTGNVVLPDQLLILQDPLVLGAAALMYIVEFFADKTPGVDTAWDAIHSFVRIPAGVMLAAGAVGDANSGLITAAGILGGSVSATSHLVKAGSRVMINTSPEPLTNWTASVLEDIAVVTGIFTALHYPLLFISLFIVFLLISIWLIPKLWRGIKLVSNKIRAFFLKKNRNNGRPPQLPS